MKKRILCLLLAFCLTGCAQTDGVSDTSSGSSSGPADRAGSDTSSASSSAPDEPILSLPQAADVPPGDYAPWQEACAGFLTELRASEYQIQLAEREAPVNDLPSESYSLYDVDKDGIPELFLRRGTCEADFCTLCYTFQDGQIVDLGSFQSGHASLYTCPDENAVLFHHGQMGHGGIEKFSIMDGPILGPWETLLTENEEDTREKGYTYPGDLVPGSEPIPTYYTSQFFPADGPALLLPIYDYQGREHLTPLDELQVRSDIGRVLYENAPLFGVSGDGFHGDTGLISLSEYLQPKTAYPYGDQPLTIQKTAWADVNGDGQTDCLLWLEQAEENWSDEFCVVLSTAGEDVYAYFFDYVEDIQINQKGDVFFQRSADHWTQASFYKNQSYIFPAPAPAEGTGLAWDLWTGKA